MEVNWKLSPELKDNSKDFNDDFFNRFSLREAKKPLNLKGDLSKNYLFPTFYQNVSCSVGIFLCDYEAARKLMIHEKITPLKMPHGRTLVIFSCYEYKNVYNISPYNEIAMTIPIMANPVFSPPVLPLLFSGLFKSFGYYVFSMPVTSYENELRGHGIWGLPKKTEKVHIDLSGDKASTSLFNKNGDTRFSLKIPKKGSQKHFDITSPLYTKKEGSILKSYTSFKGDFSLTKNLGLIAKKNLKNQRASDFLFIDHNATENSILLGLNIHPVPIQTRFSKKMNSSFDLPQSSFSL